MPDDWVPRSWITTPAFTEIELCFEWKITRPQFRRLPKQERAEMMAFFKWHRAMAAREAQEQRERDEIRRGNSGR